MTYTTVQYPQQRDKATWPHKVSDMSSVRAGSGRVNQICCLLARRVSWTAPLRCLRPARINTVR